MLIAAIAIIHVIVSHYAVGGGILIALENSRAIRKGDKKYRDYWKKHTRFFVLLTVAFGAITGVGIWWTIGLASPLATEALIRTFVFGWAIEWVFFIIEIVAAFAMYYYWDHLPGNTHRIIAWIYAIAAWISLVLITGITAFMLNSKGLIGDWNAVDGTFWQAFLNVQFLPQTILRTGGCLVLSTIYVYAHAAWTLRKPDDADLLAQVVRRMSKPLLFGIVLLMVGAVLWLINLPKSSLAVLEGAAVLNIFLGLLFGLAGVLLVLTFFGPIRNPKSMNLGFAVSLFVFGMTTLAVAEFVREAVRKPYIVDQLVLGNQIYADEIGQGRAQGGYLESGIWTERFVRKYYPAPPSETRRLVDAYGNLVGEESYKIPFDLKALGGQERLEIGRALFMHHCNDCHALDHGYSALGPLLIGENKGAIAARIRRLNEPVISMPPWCGTDADAEILAEFLESIRPERPE